MGTNYYWARNNCNHCQRHDRVHIGKHSGGWMFSFHATDTIKSWSDWKKELGESVDPFPITNEYGDRLTLANLVEVVEGSRNDKLNHFDYCMEREPSRTRRAAELGTEWKDSEGWSFSTGEFS